MPVSTAFLKLVGAAFRRHARPVDVRSLALRLAARVVRIAHPTNPSGNNRSTR